MGSKESNCRERERECVCVWVLSMKAFVMRVGDCYELELPVD